MAAPDRSPASAPPRRLLKRLAALVLALLLALVLVEVGLRVFWPQGVLTDELRYESLAGLDAGGAGYRLLPGQWIGGPGGGAINSDGLRGAELGKKRERRRVVLGDSFVFGAGVGIDEALPARLEALAGGSEQVINAGTPGYGTARELAWLESFGPGLEPDELLLCVFVGNDFSDNLSSEPPRVAGGKLFARDADRDAPQWQLTLRSWRSSLHLWRLFERRRFTADAEPVSKPDAPAVDPEARRVGLERVLDDFARQEAARLSVYLPEDAPDSALARRVGVSYDATHLALGGIAAWCREQDVSLAVVVIPDVLAVDPALLERALRTGDFTEFEGFDPKALDFERPGRGLAAWCDELGLPCLDLREAFVAETARLRAQDPASEGLYLFSDSHWNAAGHALAAELVHAWLARVGS